MSLDSSSWKTFDIGSVVDVYDYLRKPLNGKERATRKGIYPYYGASGIIDYIDDYIYDGKYLLIAEDGENLNSRKQPIAFFAEGKFWVNNHAHIVKAKEGVADDSFIKAWFQQANIAGYISGAAQPKLTQENLKRIKLKLPSLPTQRKIAAILSAYDDLIENNTRRIKILENMAQSLYQEWFVKFRFPGHEQVTFVDSPLGKIPEGWDAREVGNILKTIKRKQKIMKKDYIVEGIIPVIDQGKDFINGYTNDVEALISNDLPLIVFGDHTRIIKYIDFPFACGADGTHLLRSSEINMPMSLFYYALLKIDIGDYAYSRHFKFLKKEMILIPDRNIAREFDHFANNVHKFIKILRREIIILRKTRDLLLPKLISGELDVSNLDISIPEEMSA